MDTIVAVATPPGRSAVAVVRLSGPESLDIIRSLCQDPHFTPKPNRVLLKEIFRETGTPLDSALISFFQAPHSFTGEDIIEISCHGSPVVLRQLLDQIQRIGGHLAAPGEFTLRAWRNGKMNLSQAEAIRDLINAQTELAAVQATRQLRGELSRALASSKELLIEIIVTLESALEFVEDDLPAIQANQINKALGELISSIGALTSTYATGHLLRDGIKVAIVGRPNVGKSSVFNRLVGLDRSIVTDIAGTTRDTISVQLSWQGVPISLTDTAGIRVAEDKIEEIGVEKTHQEMAEADLVIVVVDGSTDPSSEDMEVLSKAVGSRHIVAINKCDLPIAPGVKERFSESEPLVHLSALTGEGLADLSTAILETFGRVDSQGTGLLITDSRHYDLLRRAESSLRESLDALTQSASEELVLVGLHHGLRFLGEITGETTTEDILTEIFNTFCIGK